MVTLTKGTFTGVHNVMEAHGPLMGRQATTGPIAPRLDGLERLLRPSRGRTCHGEVVFLRQTLFALHPLPGMPLARQGIRTTPRFAPFLLHSLRHGFRQIWSKGLMPSANKPLMGTGEIGASAETMQTMWSGMRRPFRPMLLPKPTLFLRMKFVTCAAGIILPRFASCDWWLYILFSWAERNSIGPSHRGLFTVPLGWWEFTVSPTLATRGALLLVSRHGRPSELYIPTPLSFSPVHLPFLPLALSSSVPLFHNIS